MIDINLPTPTVKIELSILAEKEVELWIKRDELTHPHLQGNKWRKLKYNIDSLKERKLSTLLTFGGPRSNHIYATAAAGKLYGFKAIGVIRGYENLPLTPTLKFAKEQGMELVFLSKGEYEHRFSETFLNEMSESFGNYFLLPDGGANELALKGVSELYEEIDISYAICCVPIGTGATFAGSLLAPQNKTVLGFSSLKGEGIEDEIVKMLGDRKLGNHWSINKDYHFGGYGKSTMELTNFISDFELKTAIVLDPIYTSKMIFGILDLVAKNHFKKGTRILAVHTGGLQKY